MDADGKDEPKMRRKYSSKEIKEMVWLYYGQSVSDGDLNRLRQAARNYRRSEVADKSKAK